MEFKLEITVKINVKYELNFKRGSKISSQYEVDML